MNNRPYTTKEFKDILNGINPNVEVLGEYVSSHTKIHVKCRICGCEWTPQAYGLLQGRGCPECGKRLSVENRQGKTAKRTTQEFIQELNVIAPSIAIRGEYTGSKNRIRCSCNNCGYIWDALPYRLLNGSLCPNCMKMERAAYRRYTPESFKEKLHCINPDVELLSDFTKSTDPIIVKCICCGNVWTPKAYSLLQGRGCPKCCHKRGAQNNKGKTGLKSPDGFRSELSQIDDSIELIGEYINTHTDIKCRCSRCNHIWSAKPYALLQGHGCPRCAKSGTSFMEQLILLSFREAIGNEDVLSRDKSLIGMELDIVIPKYKLAIEPGNWCLHKKSIKRDGEKRRRCKEIGYRLLTIYDKYPKGNVPPFPDNCFVYSDDLNIIDHVVIHNLIYELLDICGVGKSFSDVEWNRMEEKAYENSKSLTHEGFVKRLSVIRPDIEVIGTYENTNRRITVKCKKCGYVWNGVPANMLQGDGCRKCGAIVRGDKARKKQEDFERDLKYSNPSIRVIGAYLGRHKPIEVECLKCGNKWISTPGGLLRREYTNNPINNGCPNCAKRNRGTIKKKVLNIDTGEIFDSAIEAGEKYHIVPSAIRQCCRGVNKSSKGFHWSYVD